MPCHDAALVSAMAAEARLSFVSVDGVVRAALTIADTLKDSAAAAVAGAMRSRGAADDSAYRRHRAAADAGGGGGRHRLRCRRYAARRQGHVIQRLREEGHTVARRHRRSALEQFGGGNRDG